MATPNTPASTTPNVPTTPEVKKFKLSDFTGHAHELAMNATKRNIRLQKFGQRGYRWNIISIVKVTEDGASFTCIIEGKDGQKRKAHSAELLVDPVSAAWSSREERKSSSVPTATPAEEAAAEAALASLGFGE